jgi:hypothetical protein
MYSAACFLWGVADVMWAASFFQGQDPGASVLIMMIYAATNLLLLSALLVVAIAIRTDGISASF